MFEQLLINAKSKHDSDEFRLVLTNFLNEIENLSVQNKFQDENELEETFVELIRFLNIAALGQTVLNSFQKIFLDWIRQSQRSTAMKALFLAASRTLNDQQRKVLFIEIILTIIFSKSQENSWQQIFELFRRTETTNENKSSDRISLCCEKNAILTMFLYSNFESKISETSTVEGILRKDFELLQKLIENLINGKVEIVHGEEERALLLVGRINELIERLIQYGKSQDQTLVRLIRDFAVWLLTISADTKETIYTGLFSLIGFGKKAQYSLRFRLALKIIGTMILLQITGEPMKIRLDQNDPMVDLNLANNEILRNAIGTLSKIATTNNEYNAYKDALIHCQCEYLQNPTTTFLHIKSLFNYLCVNVFSDLPFLAHF